MNEVWIVKDNKDQVSVVHGFCLEQEQAFKIATKLTLNYLVDRLAIDCDESSEDFFNFKKIEEFLENKEYRKAYYKCREYFWYNTFEIEKIKDLKDD